MGNVRYGIVSSLNRFFLSVFLNSSVNDQAFGRHRHLILYGK